MENGITVCKEFHLDRVSSTLCDLGPVHPLKWPSLISAEHPILMWRCRTSQISQTPARLSGFIFFMIFEKKFKKVGQKGGTGRCLHLWLIDFKRGHFWSSLRIMRQTTKAHWACPYPQILFAKSDYFPKSRRRRRRTGFPRFCFASLNVKSASRNKWFSVLELFFSRPPTWWQV